MPANGCTVRGESVLKKYGIVPRISKNELSYPPYGALEQEVRISLLLVGACLQVLYYSTSRAAVLTLGSIALLVVLAGMTLFTISTPIFYWFGVPTVFVLVYACCHCECLVTKMRLTLGNV